MIKSELERKKDESERGENVLPNRLENGGMYKKSIRSLSPMSI